MVWQPRAISATQPRSLGGDLLLLLLRRSWQELYSSFCRAVSALQLGKGLSALLGETIGHTRGWQRGGSRGEKCSQSLLNEAISLVRSLKLQMAKDSSEKSSCYLVIKTLQIRALHTAEFFLSPKDHLKQLSFLSFPPSLLGLPHSLTGAGPSIDIFIPPPFRQQEIGRR